MPEGGEWRPRRSRCGRAGGEVLWSLVSLIPCLETGTVGCDRPGKGLEVPPSLKQDVEAPSRAQWSRRQWPSWPLQREPWRPAESAVDWRGAEFAPQLAWSSGLEVSGPRRGATGAPQLALGE